MVILCVKPAFRPSLTAHHITSCTKCELFKCGGCQRQFATQIFFYIQFIEMKSNEMMIDLKINGDNKFQFNFDAIAFVYLFVCLILFFYFLFSKTQTEI